MTEHLPGFGREEPPDEELDRVEMFFRNLDDFEHRAGILIRRALDEVIDGPHTGRWSIGQLSKTEKAYIGTRIEILLMSEFDIQRGQILDCLIEGVEVDIKFTIGNNWSIPREAMGLICLLVRADDQRSIYSIGLLRMIDEHLNLGRNQDQKRGVSLTGRQATRWLVLDGPLPENVLLHLDDAIREQIFSHTRSGQRRVDELFRRVQNRIIPRQTVESVAQQQDPMKRGRDARQRLLREGIVVICGTYADQRREAELLNLPVPGKGDWISTTVPEGWKPISD